MRTSRARRCRSPSCPRRQASSASHSGSLPSCPPWNYPVNLALAPAVGVLVAGHTRRSEAVGSSSATSRALAELVDRPARPGRDRRRRGGASRRSRRSSTQGSDHLIYTGTGRGTCGDGVGSLAPDAGDAGARGDLVIVGATRPDVPVRDASPGVWFNAGRDARLLLMTSSSTPLLKLALRRNSLEAIVEFFGADRKRAARTHASSTSPTLTGSCNPPTDTVVKRSRR